MPTWNGFDCLPSTRTKTSGRQWNDLWRVTTDHQRPTPSKPFKVYPEELGHMVFQGRQSMQRNLCHTPRFLEDLLQSENSFRGVATRTKPILAIIQF